MTTVAFSIGANLGDRLGSLRFAAAGLLASHPGRNSVSRIFRTAPVGGPAQPDYLNAVVVCHVSEPPSEELARRELDRAQAIESARGRTRGVRWGPRTLDVDLLVVGDLRLATADLIVPHPRAGARAFVLVPWAEMEPAFVVPGCGTVADLLARLPRSDLDGVVAVEDTLVPDGSATD